MGVVPCGELSRGECRRSTREPLDDRQAHARRKGDPRVAECAGGEVQNVTLATKPTGGDRQEGGADRLVEHRANEVRRRCFDDERLVEPSVLKHHVDRLAARDAVSLAPGLRANPSSNTGARGGRDTRQCRGQRSSSSGRGQPKWPLASPIEKKTPSFPRSTRAPMAQSPLSMRSASLTTWKMARHAEGNHHRPVGAATDLFPLAAGGPQLASRPVETYTESMSQRISSGSVFEERIGYSRAVVSGDLVFVSGTTGFDYTTMTLPEGVVQQCEQALANIERALAEAGVTLRAVVSARYILPDRADFEACWPALRRAFGVAPPAATMIVAGLLDPRMRIEIEVTARRDAPVQGIDHVQLAAPPLSEVEGRRFFGELLGLQELPKPAALAVRGGLWFQCGAQQIHIGIETDFRPAKKAHPALRLADEASLEALKMRLHAAGVATRDDKEIDEVERFFAEDPWGNRLEFVALRTSRKEA
jgi:enamine deaminase RidA (YjgF/YER057c/UK114 family)